MGDSAGTGGCWDLARGGNGLVRLVKDEEGFGYLVDDGSVGCQTPGDG